MRWGEDIDMAAHHLAIDARAHAALVRACFLAFVQASLTPDAISEWRRREMQDGIRAQVAFMRQSLNNALRFAIGRKVDDDLRAGVVEACYEVMRPILPSLFFSVQLGKPWIEPPRTSVMQPVQIDFLG